MRTTRHIKIVLLFILFLLGMVMALSGQRNTAYLSLSLPDRGKGLMYERQFKAVSGYLSFTKGKYQINNDSPLNSIKIALGLNKSIYQDKAYSFIAGAGLNYSKVWGNNDLSKLAYLPVSFDLCFGAKIQRVAVLVQIDPVKKISQLNLGYKF